MPASDESAAFKQPSTSMVFDWDEFNTAHLAKHEIKHHEAEQVILNRPIDLGTELRNGEERVVQVGETDTGRILNVVSTSLSDKRVRVVTAWPTKERLRRYFELFKRNGNAGRTEN